MKGHDGISRSDRARVIVKGIARAIVKGATRSAAKEVVHAIADAVRDLPWADWVQTLIDFVSQWFCG